MSGVNYKDILKKGWHPEKEGTSLRGQIVGWSTSLKALLVLTVFLAERLGRSWRHR